MGRWTCCALLACAPSWAAAPALDGATLRDAQALLDRESAHSPAGTGDLRVRIEDFSAALRGRPYRRDPLGEGEGAVPDADPLLRLDAFDCVTFVETVLALARAADAAQLPGLAVAIRYRGDVPTFAERNHLPSLDWLPSLERRGFAQDVTAALFGDSALRGIDLSIDRSAALARLGGPPATASQVERGTLRYLPKAALAAALDRVPSATIVLVVGPRSRFLARAGIAEAVSHLGFAIRDHGRLVLRSATLTRPASVRDEPFDHYLRRHARSPSVDGFVFLRPLPAAAEG